MKRACEDTGVYSVGKLQYSICVCGKQGTPVSHAMKAEMFKMSTICTPGLIQAAQPNKTVFFPSYRNSLSYFKNSIYFKCF